MKKFVKVAGWILPAVLMLISIRELSAEDSPAKAPSTGLSKIALGEYHIFFIVDGKIRVLGSNRAGEAGFGNNLDALHIPAKAVDVPGSVKFVDAGCGGYGSVALDDAGHVWTWGSNLHGEMGAGVADDKWHLPAKIDTDMEGKPFDNVASVAAGFHFNIAVKKDGSVWVWGLSGNDKSEFDSAGIVGNGDKASQSVLRPSRVTFPDGISITKVSPASMTALALDSTGGVWTWGGGESYDRGSDKGNGATPVKLAKLPAIKAIAAGDICSFALDAEGNLWGWGRDNAFLCQGDGKSNFAIVPDPVKLNLSDLNGRITDVETSQLTVHVLRDDKTLWGWGSSAMGEVGDGTINDWAHTKRPYAWDWDRHEKLVMAPVQVLDSVKTVCASPQAPYVYAIKTDGTIWSWGRNKTGVLANGVVPDANAAGERPNSWDVAKPGKVVPF